MQKDGGSKGANKSQVSQEEGRLYYKPSPLRMRNAKSRPKCNGKKKHKPWIIIIEQESKQCQIQGVS